MQILITIEATFQAIAISFTTSQLHILLVENHTFLQLNADNNYLKLEVPNY